MCVYNKYKLLHNIVIVQLNVFYYNKYYNFFCFQTTYYMVMGLLHRAATSG